MASPWAGRWLALLLAGCAPAADDARAPALVELPARVESAATGRPTALTLSILAAPAAAYRPQYVNVLDWEVAEATLANADATIPVLTRSAAADVDASLARRAALYFAPIRPSGGYTLSVELKRRDRTGTYQTVASGQQAGLTLADGPNVASVLVSPTGNGRLTVSVAQPALPFVPPPVIEAFFPLAGSAGMLIDLTGTGFSATPAANAVSFNGSAGTVSAASATALTAQVPAGATTGPLSVTVDAKIGTSGSAFTVVPSGTTLGTHGTGATPWGMAVDAAGNVWVANSAGTTVSKLSPAGALLGTYPAGTNPTGLVFDGSGNLWVTNALSAGKVLRLAPDGSTLGTTTTGNVPKDIGIDGLGNLWVSSTVDHALIKLNAAGTQLGYYHYGTGGSEGGGLVVTPANTIWVCDVTRDEIVQRDVSGVGMGAATTADEPIDVDQDASGNLWVVSRAGHQLQKFSSSGALLATYELGATVQPRALTVGPLGNLWIACTSPNAVMKVSPTGTILGTYAIPGGGVPNAVIIDRHRVAWVSLGVTHAVTRLAL